MDPQPVFFYDLGDPASYLVAEQIMRVLPVAPEWEPVHAAGSGLAIAAPDRRAVARRVQEAGLQELRWPGGWPPDSARAMLAATFAKSIGRAVAFSLAAFRQAFAGGRDLGEEATILIAAAACEMHPAAVLKGMSLRGVGTALEQAGGRARAAGVHTLPAIHLDGATLQGEDALEQALTALGGAHLG